MASLTVVLPAGIQITARLSGSGSQLVVLHGTTRRSHALSGKLR